MRLKRSLINKTKNTDRKYCIYKNKLPDFHISRNNK
jgi:hypothetical protein